MQPLQRSKSGVRPYLGFEGPRKEGKLQNQPETNPIIASNTHTAAEGPSLYAKHPHTAQQNAPRHARHWALPAPASLPALCLLQRSQVRTSTPPHLPLPHRQCDPASHAPGPLPDTNAPGLLLATNNQFARCPCLPPPPHTHTVSLHRFGDPELLSKIMAVDPYFITQVGHTGTADNRQPARRRQQKHAVCADSSQ